MFGGERGIIFSKLQKKNSFIIGYLLILKKKWNKIVYKKK